MSLNHKPSSLCSSSGPTGSLRMLSLWGGSALSAPSGNFRITIDSRSATFPQAK